MGEAANSSVLKRVFFITHPEIEIDTAIPVPDWPLSEKGLERMRLFADRSLVFKIGSIYCSEERKAVDSARLLSERLGLPFTRIAELGENDRSSTGYLPSEEFERTADAFFASPNSSVRGWETAIHAQERITNAIDRIIETDQFDENIAIVAHGGVGALALCKLMNAAIDRIHDQPGSGGGNCFCFDADTKNLVHGWKSIEAL